MRFSYTALDAAGRRRRGQGLAIDAAALEARLLAQGLFLVRCKAKTARRPRLSRLALLHFFHQMAALLSAGIPLAEALDDLAEDARDPALGSFLDKLRTRIHAGQMLSEALSDEAEFAGAPHAMLAAGEAAGRLPEAFLRLADAQESAASLAARAQKLLLYPMLAGLAVLGAAAFLLFWLAPQVEPFLAQLGGELPWHSKALFGLSAFLRAHPGSTALGIFALFAALAFGLPRLAKRQGFARMALGLPGYGKWRQKFEIARFASALSLLCESGLGIHSALPLARGLIGNAALKEAIGDVERQIIGGAPMSLAFAACPFMPPLAARMVRVAERTGRLDESLAHAARHCNREAMHAAEQAIALIEPALTLLLGLVLAFFLLAMFSPIYGRIAQIG
jgi:type IV pilus assembly protein PilC